MNKTKQNKAPRIKSKSERFNNVLKQIDSSHPDDEVKALFTVLIKAFDLNHPAGGERSMGNPFALDPATNKYKALCKTDFDREQTAGALNLIAELGKLYRDIATVLGNFVSFCQSDRSKSDCAKLQEWISITKDKFQFDVFTALELKASKVAWRESAMVNVQTQQVQELAERLIYQNSSSIEEGVFLNISFQEMDIVGFGEVLKRIGEVRRALVNLSRATFEPDNKDVMGLVTGYDGIAHQKLFDFWQIEQKKPNVLRGRHRANLELITESGSEYRRLTQVDVNVLQRVESLVEQFPNFQATIDYFSQQMALSRLTKNRVFNAHPVLLVGPPGVGKTAFVQALARIIGVGFQNIDMGSMSAGFVLGGSSPHWAEGSSGEILTTLRDGPHANPIFLLDEIDKVGGDHRYDPLGPLHTLLEGESSRCFVDESVGIPVDASHVIWIATANRLENIPEPIISRFQVVEVNKAEGDDAQRVIRSVWKSILKSEAWGEFFTPELKPEVLLKLMGEPPREAKRILKETCGRIAYRRELGCNNQFEVTLFDLGLSDSKEIQTVGTGGLLH